MKQDIQQNEKLAGNKMLSQQVDEQQVGRASKRRASLDQYDQLIGAIDQGTSSTRFLVFERGTGRLIASSQLEIKRITPREGWVEIDPNSIMSSVYATMANVHDQLVAKLNLDQTSNMSEQQQLINETTSFMDQKCFGLGPQLLKCIGICNQRESAVVWDSKTGQPLYNVIVWMDNRTKDIVDDMIDSIPGRDFNHLKDKTGLPMSTYFSAFKLRWLIDNVPEVQAALREKRLLVGTVDSWILWNLTGRHLTDVTNASRTFLMDIETLQWDKTLCKQFKVPINILPRILSSADDFGALQFGPFMGTPVTGVIGDQSAALFGHSCLQMGQTKATFGTGCFIMQNIGPGPLNGALAGVQREAKRGLITTVGYKLKDKPVCYALEGSIKIAGAALTWLRDNMQLIQNYEECDQLVNTTTNSAGVFFVPALGGLYSPYWDPNAAGLFIGLSQFTRREHLVRATFDSIAFQTNDILSLMRGVTNGLMIDGGLCKSDNLCQIMADITGCEIVRPSMCETSALGAAMVAGCGAGIWDYDSMMAHSNTPHEYACSSNQTHHYPHESLNYDENKFAHPLHHQPQSTSKCFKSSPSKLAPNYEEQQQQQQKHADSQEVQHQQQPSKLHRRSLRHRNGGRLMRNLDAGGGINDDAGGGGGGGGDGGRNTGALPATRLSLIYSSEEDDDAYSSAGHVASSDTDFEPAGPQGTLSSTSSSGEFIGAQQPLPLPAVIEGRSIESEVNLLAGTVGQSVESRTSTNLVNNLNVKQGAPASSSGYNSGDNFESASTSCALTDSLRLSDRRTESPLSQTMSGRDSVVTFTDSTNDKRHQNSDQADSLASNSTPSESARSSVQLTNVHQTTPAPATFPFNLTNFMDQQRADSAAFVARAEQEAEALNQHHHESRNLNDSNATATTMVAPVVQQVNNMKFAEKAEHVADEVHEFGGRDSYGEDGYDSSTVSFDSYDDDGEMGALQDVLMLQHEAEVAYYADHNGELEPERRVDEAILATHSELPGHSARRQPSLLEKQMDIFQSYISLEHRTELVDTWRAAVSRSMQWTKVHHEEVRRIDYQRLSSLPISMYVFFSLGLVALSGCLSPNSLISN